MTEIQFNKQEPLRNYLYVNFCVLSELFPVIRENFSKVRLRLANIEFEINNHLYVIHKNS